MSLLPTKKPAGTWRGRARQTSVVAAGFKGLAPLGCSSGESIIALRDGRKRAAAGWSRDADGDGARGPDPVLRRRRRAAARARARARRRRVELGRARPGARAPAPRPRAGSPRPRRLVAAAGRADTLAVRRRRGGARRAGAGVSSDGRRALARRPRRAAAGAQASGGRAYARAGGRGRDLVGHTRPPGGADDDLARAAGPDRGAV